MFLPLRALCIFLFSSASLASKHQDLDGGCRLTGALVTGLVGTLIDSRRDLESFNCADIFSISLCIEHFFFLAKPGVADLDARDISSFNDSICHLNASISAPRLASESLSLLSILSVPMFALSLS